MTNDTVAALIQDARWLADAETDDGTVDFTNDVEMLRYLNRAYRHLVSDIVRFGGQDLLVTNTTVSSPYTITAGVLYIVAVEIPDGNEGWIDLRHFNFRERNRRGSNEYPVWRWLPEAAAGGTLKLYPETSAPASLRVWYVPNITPIEADDTISTFLGWDAYLSARMAQLMLTKEERSNSQVAEEFKFARETVQSACKNLNAGKPEQVALTNFVPEDFFDDVHQDVNHHWPRP